MKDNLAPKTIRLSEYRVPNYLIETTRLHFFLDEDYTQVTADLEIFLNPKSDVTNAPLELNGADLELIKIAIDGEALEISEYVIDGETLTIAQVPTKFTLHIETKICPQENSSLEGLYQSNGMFCTQCEAEGFRKITYYLDRPDVMSKFTTTINADKAKYPVLLSNGNPINQGEEGGRHWVSWEDPFKKPCYLFALVAGDLTVVEDSFTTMTGREIKLEIFVESQDSEKCDHAMQALKDSMAWDEKVYGREYDLDIYMIVAVSHFNMGAMENKGLNVFNTSCVLAHPKTTTDAGFNRVQAVIAHEYFHNWSGNRVTCRDWFQLSLKEGFTVFRDQEFSADMGSHTVKRVEDVAVLRTAQFAEDAGPMAHPIRPDSYIEINNFYTVTVYEKGAEIVRMLRTLVGEEGFRKGTDLYFERHDGEAVTTEDFVAAIEAANEIDLSQFKRWYSQAGTPTLEVKESYHPAKQEYHLNIIQSCPATPGQDHKDSFHIPLKLGLLNSDGDDIGLKLSQEQVGSLTGDVLSVTQAAETFVFENVAEQPLPSLGRGFSAPVHVQFEYTKDQLAFLMSNDNDGFNRWDAANRLTSQVLLEGVANLASGGNLKIDDVLLSAIGAVLNNQGMDSATKASLLSLPSEAYLAQQMAVVDVNGIHQAREALRHAIALKYKDELLSLYSNNNQSQEYQPSFEQISARSLKNLCLSYLMSLNDPEVIAQCLQQYHQANNMTEQGAAFRLLVHSDSVSKDAVVEAFYTQWQNEPLVVDQWLQIQASAPVENALEIVNGLMRHECFEMTNPNKVRALVGAFCNANPINFHKPDGSGYEFLADRVLELDKLNPQIAARLVGMLSRWRKYDTHQQDLAVMQLKRIIVEPNLSPDVYEVVQKSMA